MDLLLGLVIGMIVGLLINWVLSPILDRSDSSGLQQTLASLQERIENLELAQGNRSIKTIVVRGKDDLVHIPGIDPPIARCLNEAGIYTFEQLAAMEPDRLRQLVKFTDDRSAEVKGWIEAARDLATRRET